MTALKLTNILDECIDINSDLRVNIYEKGFNDEITLSKAEAKKISNLLTTFEEISIGILNNIHINTVNDIGEKDND